MTEVPEHLKARAREARARSSGVPQESTPLTYWLDLNELNAKWASYKGPNDSVVTIDRAAFESGGKPLTVTLTLGKVET